ncbi:MAG: hypothetical protein R3B13_32465 [Polyangiaceae bacterium]
MARTGFRRRLQGCTLAIACAVSGVAVAEVEPPPTEEELAEERAADEALSIDSWYIRGDASLAYVNAATEYHPTADDSQKKRLVADGMGLGLHLGVGLRPVTDVTLGLLGSITHVPLTRLDGQFSGKGQGLYYGQAYIDHRLPVKVLRIGAGAGLGQIYTFGPEEEGYAGLGPVGSIWLAIDLPTSRHVALGVVAEFTGSAIRDTHDLQGEEHEFNTFMLVASIGFSLRISEPSLPKSMPSLAYGAAPSTL